MPANRQRMLTLRDLLRQIEMREGAVHVRLHDRSWNAVVSHGRYVTFQLAEVAVPRQMFADILSLITRLRAPALV